MATHWDEIVGWLRRHAAGDAARIRPPAPEALVVEVETAVGDLRVLVDATCPLDAAADAHRAGLAGHAPGKLVLIP